MKMRIRWDSPTQYMMHRGMEHSLKPALGNLRHEASEYNEADGEDHVHIWVRDGIRTPTKSYTGRHADARGSGP